MKPNLDCRTLAGMLSASLDQNEPLVQRARMRLHLCTCAPCRAVEEQMRFIRAAMRRPRDAARHGQ